MFHAINVRLARLARRTAPRPVRDLEPATASRTWAQAAIARRIGALGPARHTPAAGRDA